MERNYTKLEMFERALNRIFESWRGKQVFVEYNDDGDLIIRPFGGVTDVFHGIVFDRIAILANAMEMEYWITYDNIGIYIRVYE